MNNLLHGRSILVALCLLHLIGLCMILASCGLLSDQSCDTRDVADYGAFHDDGNRNLVMREAFQAYFPEKIEPYYQDVQYRYHAVNMLNEWTAELYLEFTVEDETQYRSLVEAVRPMEEFTRFSYAPEYREYVFDDYYMRRTLEEGEAVRLDEADIQKVLIQPEEHRIIYVALRSPDSAEPVTTLTTYFDRFGIDPAEYGISDRDWETYKTSAYKHIGGELITFGGRKEAPAVKAAVLEMIPEEFPESVEILRYHYKGLGASSGKDTAELFLECAARDERQFFELTAAVGAPEDFTPFAFGEGMQERVWSDVYELGENGCIRQADIRKVIIQPEAKRFIYVILLVKEPDTIEPIQFMSYMNRFEIDIHNYRSPD